MKRRHGVFNHWLCSVLISLACVLPAKAANDINIHYEKFTLDNGLTVIVHEDRKAPVVAAAVCLNTLCLTALKTTTTNGLNPFKR